MHEICIFTLCSNTNSSAVSVKLAEMQFGYSWTCHYHLASSKTI